MDRQPTSSGELEPAEFEPTERGLLTCDEAVQIAKDRASHLIGDGKIQQVSPDPGTCAPGLEPRQTLSNRGTWFVSLRGLFYEPSGPPLPAGAPESTPLLPVCSEIVVQVDDWTGEAGPLTFARASGCD